MDDSTKRAAIAQAILEGMGSMKRAMALRMQSTSEDSPLSRSQLEVLYTIQHMQPVNFKHIAQKLYMTPSAVSQVVEPLERNGYIVRRPDPTDRRIQYLEVTDTAIVQMRAVDARRQELMQSVMAELTTKELEIWLQIQAKMISKLTTDQ